jgi:hypothetical protein
MFNRGGCLPGYFPPLEIVLNWRRPGGPTAPEREHWPWAAAVAPKVMLEAGHLSYSFETEIFHHARGHRIKFIRELALHLNRFACPSD